VGGEGAATEPALGCFTYRGGTADRKQVKKCAAIDYIRLNASMIKQKTNMSGGIDSPPHHCTNGLSPTRPVNSFNSANHSLYLYSLQRDFIYSTYQPTTGGGG